MSSWSVPIASIRPPSIRTMRSATWIDARLCEIRNVVRDLGEFLDRLANEQLVLDIDGAGRLVEDQDGRIAEHGAGQRDSLALAAREAIARARRSGCRSPAGAR